MATRMAQVPLPNCEICEQNIGRRYCIDCEQYFCKTCEDFHLKTKSCKNHVFKDLGQINPEEKKVKCKEHEENMTYYCTTCAMLVCKICLPNKHTKHEFTLTSEAASKFKTDLTEKIETMKTVVGSIAQQRAKLEEKSNQFLILTQNLVQEINQKGNELKNVVDKIVGDTVSNVTKEQQNNLERKTKEEYIMKDAQERGQMVILKLTNAVENQGDTMLLNSFQSLQQAMKSMPDIVDSDMEFPALNFEDGYLNETKLTKMIGRVMLYKKDEPVMVKSNMLRVTQLPSSTSQDHLKYVFENTKKFGGGDVEDVEYDEETRTAIITFKDDEGNYMYNSPYGPYQGQGQGHPYGFDPHQQVQQFVPHENPTFNLEQSEKEEPTEAQSSSPNAEYLEEENPVQQEEKDEDRDEGKLEEKHRKTTTNMLKVTKLPPGTTAEFLENFFENTRKFGGGDVHDVEYDEDTASAIITFEEDEAVEIVLKKIPILFNKKAIEVSAHNVNEEEPVDTTEEYESNLSTSEPSPTCTIEVRGMTDRTTQDTIMYYFESRKGAGADVETIEYIEDKDMYLLTFEEEEAVYRTIQTTHTVDGSRLQVKKHIPPKRYSNKALVKGLHPKTTDSIINYLEVKTRLDVEEVEFGEGDSGKAIFTFSEPIDIGAIQTVCKKKAFDDSYLTVHPVVVTNCIVVRGFSEKTTERGLEYYFDNKWISGVEGVTDIEMNKDYCVVYFENAEDALLACKRSHTIDNCTLKVQVFYDCLGVPADK